ncbi:hypothetical protein AURDEDRAFT_167193 [Auricularia subglabra TFB-10046 SS5]|nr:hypothetical protein AURDEDRAFT_167193 [Auricularia subglabra TFB-10046 SS5]
MPLSRRGFALARDRIHSIVDRAIQPLAHQFNKRCYMHALPSELFQQIVSLLSPRDVYCAALVCQAWRQAMLGCPLLWTRVCIFQRNACDVDGQALAGLITLLLSRSGDLPLTIEYEYSGVKDSTWNNTYGHVATSLMHQMHRIASLSLVLPHIESTHFERLLLTPAPLLEYFRLHVVAANASLRSGIFPGATRLRHVSLSGVCFPQWAYAALLPVKHLVYDAGEIDDVDVDQISKLFPALRSLTLIGYRCKVARAHLCPQALALRVSNVRNISRVFEAFPNAVSISLGASAQQRDPAAFQRLLMASRSPASIEVAHASWDTSVLMVKLDGVVVAIDPKFQDVVGAFDQLAPNFYDGLRDLCVSGDNWSIFAAAPLPALDTLTIFLSETAGWQAEVTQAPSQTPLRVGVLRLVRQWGDGNIHATDILDLILTIVDAQMLRRIMLCGTSFSSDCTMLPELDFGNQGSLHHLDVVFQPLPLATFWSHLRGECAPHPPSLVMASESPASIEVSHAATFISPLVVKLGDGVLVVRDPTAQDVASAFHHMSPNIYDKLRDLSVSSLSWRIFAVIPLPALDTLTVFLWGTSK